MRLSELLIFAFLRDSGHGPMQGIIKQEVCFVARQSDQFQDFKRWVRWQHFVFVFICFCLSSITAIRAKPRMNLQHCWDLESGIVKYSVIRLNGQITDNLIDAHKTSSRAFAALVQAWNWPHQVVIMVNSIYFSMMCDHLFPTVVAAVWFVELI